MCGRDSTDHLCSLIYTMRKQKPTGTVRGNYRCGLCGGMKKNHNCPMLIDSTQKREAGTEVRVVMVMTAGKGQAGRGTRKEDGRPTPTHTHHPLHTIPHTAGRPLPHARPRERARPHTLRPAGAPQHPPHVRHRQLPRPPSAAAAAGGPRALRAPGGGGGGGRGRALRPCPFRRGPGLCPHAGGGRGPGALPGGGAGGWGRGRGRGGAFPYVNNTSE